MTEPSPISWLARSISHTLRLDDEDEDLNEFKHRHLNDAVNSNAVNVDEDPTAVYEDIDLEDRSNNLNNSDENNRGVKEDLTEFTETLTRHLWGVASLLAPPPPPPPEPAQYSDRDRGGGSECAGDDVEDCEEDAVGVTEEVLAFAVNIAHHPETWLDFPLADEDEFDDFELSDTQQMHAYAVERLTPRLAALRIELCPAHMTEGFFWMVYFVLLYSRLKKHDAELLSTPQLVEARAMWMQELQKKTKPQSDWFGIGAFHAKEIVHSPHGDFESNSSEDAFSRHVIQRTFAFEPSALHATSDTETEKHSIENTEIQFIDKAVIEEDPPSKIIEMEVAAGPSSKTPMIDYDEHEDDWLKDNVELEGYAGTGIVNEEDVSFSDLEDDIDYKMQGRLNAIDNKARVLSPTI